MKCTVILLSLIGVMAVFAQASAPPDNYEPNNSFATAYPLGVGDSVVKSATVFGSVNFESDNPFTSFGSDIDVDFFKVTLERGTLLSVTAFPAWLKGVDADTLTNDHWRWRLFLIDSSCTMILCGGGPLFEFAAHYSGVFYIAVTSFPMVGFPGRYGLSVSERTIIFEQFIEVPDTGLHEDTSGYRMNVDFDTTDLSVNLTLHENVSGRISAKVLMPNDFDTAVNMQGAIKTVWIEADSSIASSIKTADIIIPYSLADISGFSENSLRVLRLNDTTHQWAPVDYTLDTVKHQIVAHTTHFSIYGVFVSANTAVRSAPVNNLSVSALTVDFLPRMRRIAVHFSLPGATNADIKLYNLQGVCVKESRNFFAGKGNSTLQWDLGTLAGGRYFLTVKAGTLLMKKPILIMN